MSTYDKVKEIIIDRLDVEADKVTEDAQFIEDLGADSLDTYELLQGVEEEFNISISEDEAQGFKKVSEVVAYIDANK